MTPLFLPEDVSRIKLLIEVAVALEERTLIESSIVIGEGFALPVTITYDPSLSDGSPKGVEMSISSHTSSSNNSSGGNKRYEAIGRMVTHMAHDINNMLNIIGGNIELINKRINGCENSTFIAERISRINEAAKKCRNLTTGVVDYAHYGSKKLETFDTHEAISSMLNLLRTSMPKAIKINTNYDAQNAKIFGGTSEIEDVIVNIIQNAKDAMDERGTITISTTNVSIYTARTSEYGFSPGTGDFLLISFADNGLGMTEETRKRIFEPFFTTKGDENGTGLGLNNVMNIVKSHGGFIEVNSKPAVGTVFDLYLPVADQVAEANEVHVAESTANVGKSDFAVV